MLLLHLLGASGLFVASVVTKRAHFRLIGRFSVQPSGLVSPYCGTPHFRAFRMTVNPSESFGVTWDVFTICKSR